MALYLRQTFSKPISGYWDGGPKSVFDWSIDGHVQTDKKGKFVRIGSFSANHWFHVAVGKTEKATLTNAKRRLAAVAKKRGLTCTVAFIEKLKDNPGTAYHESKKATALEMVEGGKFGFLSPRRVQYWQGQTDAHARSAEMSRAEGMKNPRHHRHNPCGTKSNPVSKGTKLGIGLAIVAALGVGAYFLFRKPKV